MPRKKRTYEDTIKEIEELKELISKHRKKEIRLTNYAKVVKRLMFLKNSARRLKPKNHNEDEGEIEW